MSPSQIETRMTPKSTDSWTKLFQMLATTRAKEIFGTSREFRFESVTSLAENHRLTQHQFRMLHGIAETKPPLCVCGCASVSENIIFN